MYSILWASGFSTLISISLSFALYRLIWEEERTRRKAAPAKRQASKGRGEGRVDRLIVSIANGLISRARAIYTWAARNAKFRSPRARARIGRRI